MVTMYHWDLPQRLQELGGWTNPEVSEIFVEFARVLFTHFGDRVHFWTTFNEPGQFCLSSYNYNLQAPGLDFPGIPNYLCSHNVLKAHAEVYHLYKNEFTLQTGVIGMTIDSPWYEPATNSSSELQASEQSLQFYFGMYMHPILSPAGNYPQVMIDQIEKNSEKQGFSKSRLPKFTPEEINRLKGTVDYIAINHYTSRIATLNDEANSAALREPSYEHDQGTILTSDPNWPGARFKV